MKRQFQSKAVPRGTRTIWRYLSALFLLLSLSIGQMWGDQMWDFTTMSSADKTAYDAATTAWSWNSNGYYSNQFTANNGVWTDVISTTITQIKNFKFKRSGSNLGTGTIRVYKNSSNNSDGYLGYNNSNVHIGFTAAIGDTVIVSYFNNESSSTKGYVLTGLKRIKDNATTIQVAKQTSTVDTLIATAASVDMKCESSKIRLYKIDLRNPASSGGGCTAPTNATITANPANAEYTAGDNISLTASAENATSATFTWYKGTDWATASAGSSVGTGATFSKNSCTTDDEGTYWCNISNGTGCEVQVSKAITVASSGGGEDPEPPAVVCPESGVLFSADAKTTSDKSFSTGTTEITSSDADITGGKVYAISGQSDSKKLLTKSGQFSMTNNNTIFKFELDCALAAGDKITIDGQGGVKSDVNKGLWVTSAEDRPSSAPACSGDNGTDGWYEPILSYVVTSTDEYVGKTTLFIHRQAGATQNFDNVVITRPYNISYVSAKGTAQTTPTKGFEVALTQITGVDGWNHTGWTANKAVKVGTTDYAVGDEIPASATAKLSDDTQFTAVWVEVLSPAETPVIATDPASANYSWKDAIAALTVSVNSVSDGGTLSYQWYKEAGETDEKVGTNAASYTPEEAGTYYVVVTNSKAGKESASATSNNAVITIAARPSYTVTYYDGTTSLGSESVLEDASPAEYAAKQAKACYNFANWKNNADVVIVPASLVVTKDTALYGNWTANYAFSDYSFVNVAEVGTAPNKLTMTDGTTVNVAAGSRVDNIYFSAMAIKYESGASTVLTDYKGWKINTENATITFLLENDAQVKVGIGQKTDLNVLYTATDGTAKNVTLTQQSEGVYNAKGGTIVTLRMTSGNTTTLKYIKIGEIPAKSDVATLSDLTLKYGEAAAATISGFSASKYIYNVDVPYGTAKADLPIVGATATDPTNALVSINQAKDREDWKTVIRVQAEDRIDDHDKYYEVRFNVLPKLGVELIKVVVPAGTHNDTEATGYFGGTGDTKNEGNSLKIGGGCYAGVVLTTEKTFKAGDVINIHTSAVSTSGGSVIKIYAENSASTLLYNTETIGGDAAGNNFFVLPEAVNNVSSLYVVRTDDNKWNGSIDYIAVYRQMAPFIEEFTIEDVEDFVIDQENKTITASVANSFDVTALTPTVKYWGNGGGAIDKTGAQNFTNPVQYTVSSAYSEDATGDYAPVTYTVTINKIVPAETPDITTNPAGANYYEGATITALNVEASVTDGGTLSYQWQEQEGANWNNITNATNDSYTPTVSAIGTYKYRVIVTNTLAGHPAAQDTSAVATIVIAEDPAAIKLIVDGTSGKEVNTTNYITGVTASKVTIGTTEYDCVTFAGTVGSSVAASNMKYLDRHVTYNATTTQTKIKLSLYNSSSNKRTIYVQGVIEGNTSTGDIVNLLTLQLNGKEEKTTDYIEFNNAKNRSIYVFVSSDAGDIKILQEKVIESGEPLKKAGDSGYSLNMNKGRMFGAQGATIAFEGMTYTLNGDYAPVNSTVLKVKSNDIVFVAAAPTLMKVTTANDKTYYVTKDAAGEDNETAKTGVSEFDLTAGTWYITAGGSEVQFTKIEFVAPKCAEPQFNALQNSDICAGDPYVALDGTATVADAGTPIYQWYKAEGDVEIEGATNETYTPTADGSYYVIATNQLAGYTDNVKKSATVTVTTYASAAITTAPESQRKEAGQNATLTVEATGKAPLTYQWYTCDVNGDNAIIIDGAEAATYQVEVTAGMSQYYKVVVGSGCGSAEVVALVAEWHEVAPANVTGSITWDWAGSAWSGISGDIAFANTGVEELMANVSSKVPVSDAGNFRADMLYGTGQYVWRSSNKFFQGTKIRFITEVPGFLTVHYRNTSGSTNTRRIEVVNNGETLAEDGTSTTNNWKWTNKVFVQAGEVILNGIASEANGLTRIDQIVFNANPDYTRNVSNNIGTLCVDHNVPAGQYLGATFYQIASRNEEYDFKIDFEEVLPNEELKAGEPYIFQSTTGRIDLFYGETVAPAPVDVRGMHGWFSNTEEFTKLDITEENMSDILYISQNKLWSCENLVDDDLGLKVVNNRAYIVMSEVPTYANYVASQQNNGAPRRRVTMGRNGEQSATGFENLNASEKPMKLMINGQIFILRGEKMFDATGRLVK